MTNEEMLRLLAQDPRNGYLFQDNGMQKQAVPLYGQGQRVGEGEDGVYESGPLQGYRVADYMPGQTIYDNNGRPYTEFNAQGQQTGTGTFSGLGDKGMDFFETYILPAMALATGAGMANAIGGLGAGATSGAGGFIGEGAASGIPAWDGALVNAGTVGTSASTLGQNGAFLGENMASGVPAWDAAATNAGLSLTAPAGASFGGNTISNGVQNAATSLIPGVSNSMLGTGLTALTALSGSQGTEGQTTERKMDPRLDQYVYGTNGLIPSAAGLLASQMPQAQQVGQQLNTMGTGLLGRGIAPNGFERFTKGRY